MKKQRGPDKSPRPKTGYQGNQNKAKGPEKKLVSGRIELPDHTALEAQAMSKGLNLSAYVARVLTEQARGVKNL